MELRPLGSLFGSLAQEVGRRTTVSPDAGHIADAVQVVQLGTRRAPLDPRAMADRVVPTSRPARAGCEPRLTQRKDVIGLADGPPRLLVPLTTLGL